MHHKPIKFKDLGLIYPHKICFQDFSDEIHSGDRIALIGRNGSGKSTLLKTEAVKIRVQTGHFTFKTGL